MCEPAAKIAKIMPEFTASTNGLLATSGCKTETGLANGSSPLKESITENEQATTKSCKISNGHSITEPEAAKNGTAENGADKMAETEGDGSVLLIKKLSNEAKLPKRGSIHAAGFDLYSADECVIPAKGKQIVPTKLSITVPYGSYGRIAPRSGLAWKHFIDVGAGVIDRDYTGEVGVLLFNFSDKDFTVGKEERIAQLIIEKIFIPQLMVVEELPKTERGATGYGASGKH